MLGDSGRKAALTLQQGPSCSLELQALLPTSLRTSSSQSSTFYLKMSLEDAADNRREKDSVTLPWSSLSCLELSPRSAGGNFPGWEHIQREQPSLGTELGFLQQRFLHLKEFLWAQVTLRKVNTGAGHEQSPKAQNQIFEVPSSPNHSCDNGKEQKQPRQ